MVLAVEMRVSNYWILNTKINKNEPSNVKEIKKYGSAIISKCQNILALTDDPYCKEQLKLVIHNTTKLLTMASESSIKQSAENGCKIMEACRELQTNIFSIPATIQTPTDFATANYRLALVCFYILALSAALAVGATFGAWYFSILTASYFIDALVIALATIGIPSVCIGLLSLGIYLVQKNPVENQFTELKENIDLFCNEMTQLVPELQADQKVIGSNEL